MSLLVPGAPVEEIITFYELFYASDKGRILKFVSIHLDEVQKKTSEVLGASKDSVHIQFQVCKGTRKDLLAALKRAIQCL